MPQSGHGGRKSGVTAVGVATKVMHLLERLFSKSLMKLDTNTATTRSLTVHTIVPLDVANNEP
ncbi:MAG TPA: hypothetical protein QF901_03545, partial [Gammaproteobacteria bacterium]|nr:hypothetical protein [Gammaproteobacteria bacterium]